MYIRKTKHYVIALLVIFLIFGNSLNILAAEENEAVFTNDNQTSTYPVLEKLLDSVFSSNSLTSATLQIRDQNNMDITQAWQHHIQDLYEQSKFECIIEIIKNQQLKLSTEKKEIVDIELNGSVQKQKITQEFYEIATSDSYTKEWIVKLTGYITYSLFSQEILSATNPTLSLIYAPFGAAWSAWMNNVSTGHTIRSSSVLFWGRYTMMGSMQIHPFLPLVDYNFGTFTESMVGYPDF